ncbi:MAG TPA: glutamyl-tRNA reductase [Candidatus Baltobacteraceae bacterium]|jgi:glutamyl-tRNA reductase|nr:glutamyl-tRNA reductase [Candidatus Baltobacteraceae bacterium]
MPLVCLGLSHNTAPVEVRERHAFPPSRVVEALVALHDYEAVKEAVMLQTCGRLEIYAEIDDYEAGVAQLKSFLSNFGHAMARDRYDLDSYLYTLLGRQAIEHLFRVATGLDSMLIGEAEILGQVKDAYLQAQHAKSLGKTLHRLFREALNAGKHARSQTRIGDESTSIATAAIEAAKARLGTLDKKSVVVIGAGKMGRTAVRRLRDEGAQHLIVTNRTMSRAQELIAEVGFGEAIDMPGLADALAAADIVVTSTGASHFIVSPAHVTKAMAKRPQRPLFFIDIAVPRDVDPAVAVIENVALIDIDGLKSVIDEKMEIRREAIPQVEEIIEEFIGRFGAWYQSRLAVPVIASLTQKAEAVRVYELERLLARCPDLTEREKMLITGMSMTIVSKLLHSAVVKIREKATHNHAEAISHARMLDELFELNLAEAMAELLPHPVVADLDE